MNLPNRITLGRLVLTLALFVVLVLIDNALIERRLGGMIAFVLFVSATASDWIDGFLARKLGQVTVFGRIMDPFVDKLVVCGTLIFIIPMTPVLDSWMVAVIIGREFFVSAIRGFAESRGVSFAAEMPGKIKMVLQSFAIGAIIFQIGVGDPFTGDPKWVDVLARIGVWAAVISTLYSGYLYARKAAVAFRGATY